MAALEPARGAIPHHGGRTRAAMQCAGRRTSDVAPSPTARLLAACPLRADSFSCSARTWTGTRSGRSCWRSGDTAPEIARERLVWHREPNVPALEIDFPALFRRVIGEA